MGIYTHTLCANACLLVKDLAVETLLLTELSALNQYNKNVAYENVVYVLLVIAPIAYVGKW